MVFKLLRTDSNEPCKIKLPVGKHLIGRGKFLDCEDKRVSRNHGELEVFGDTVVIKALHQNPCFMIRKGTEEVQIIKKDCTVNLDNGDRFGLLPNTYWYELLHCAFTDGDKDDEQIQSQVYEDDYNSIATEPMDCGDSTRHDVDEVVDFHLNDTVEENPVGSPSLLPPENQISESPSTATRQTSNEEPNLNEAPSSPAKRCRSQGSHSQDDESTVKKIKTEPVEEQKLEVKSEPGLDAAGPSNNQAASSSNANDGGSKSPPQNQILRERCMYGANCYRKNPQHKAQFSHPTDPDWGSGAQVPCPRGASCCKTDPRHLRDHSHPPGAPQAPQPRPLPFQPNPGNKKRKTKPKRKSDSDEDDEDQTQSNIVQGKRTRKTINRPSNWSGSESENEEDPYGTDESDEWQPPSDITDSQLYSQDYSQI
ncbi:aprataxin and PNK-like factor isoform X1 [Ostrinia furnacalis]|uniref:aprataxin and PNK-like factor isoform X1 n=1 Tax=Ostrinia furnacalis TaxID=93504 RepID=UPI00103E0640|nr:aprataxin and PNK-like factor isoform X1 [Ostrinia furnacalis]